MFFRLDPGGMYEQPEEALRPGQQGEGILKQLVFLSEQFFHLKMMAEGQQLAMQLSLRKIQILMAWAKHWGESVWQVLNRMALNCNNNNNNKMGRRMGK